MKNNDLRLSILTGLELFAMIEVTYKECARDSPHDRTPTCPEGKVVKAERWVPMLAPIGRWVLFLPL